MYIYIIKLLEVWLASPNTFWSARYTLSSKQIWTVLPSHQSSLLVTIFHMYQYFILFACRSDQIAPNPTTQAKLRVYTLTRIWVNWGR